MRIERLLRDNAARRADTTAVSCELTSLTWDELDAAASRVANSLLDRGHDPQERITIVLPNCHTIPICYYAAWKCNLVTVAVNPKMTAPEIARIVRHSGSSAMIAGTQAAVDAARECDGIRTLITAEGVVVDNGPTLDELLATGDPTDPPAIGVGTDLRSLRYTSGTTGAPKGCMATHEQQLASVSNYLAQIDVPRTRPTYLSVPMTLGVGAFYLTATSYLGAPLLVRRRFDVDGFLADVRDHQVAHAFLVPTMMLDLERRLGEIDTDTTGLDLLGYGGAQISWALVEALHRRLGCDLYQGLGATEAGGFATLLTPEDHRELLEVAGDSPLAPVGRAAAYADVAIVDDAGRQVADGETGELRIRSASNFSGYWGQPELTRRTLLDGWLSLGDVAFRDGRGFIFLVDRKGGVIRTGSQNVFPSEIEAVLNEHPAVVRSAVLGIPDERFGERVVALVVRAHGIDELDEDALVDYGAARLAPHKRPRAITFTPELPFDEGGKLRRTELSALLERLTSELEEIS